MEKHFTRTADGKIVIRTVQKIKVRTKPGKTLVYENNASVTKPDTDRIRPYLSQYNGKHSLSRSEHIRRERQEQQYHQELSAWQQREERMKEQQDAIPWAIAKLSRMVQKAPDTYCPWL